MDDCVGGEASLHEVFLCFPLPDQNLAIAQLVQPVARVGATHAADNDNLIGSGSFGSVNLRLLAQPVNLLRILALGVIKLWGVPLL